jgi:hypothetical protein
MTTRVASICFALLQQRFGSYTYHPLELCLSQGGKW